MYAASGISLAWMTSAWDGLASVRVSWKIQEDPHMGSCEMFSAWLDVLRQFALEATIAQRQVAMLSSYVSC